MSTIEQIQQHLEGAKHYAECSRGECNRCDSWFYETGDMQAHVRAYANDVEFLLAELDELRTSNSRLTASVDVFVSALVDELFKKDHAAMVAELHELRTKDLEASKRLRTELESMPQTIRAIFESARVDARARGVPIVRALVDMVANARTVQMNRGVELDALRDECRKHLARINVLESENAALREDTARTVLDASAPIPMILHCPVCHARHIDEGELATKPHKTHACQSCGILWRPAIAPTVGVQFLPGCKNEPVQRNPTPDEVRTAWQDWGRSVGAIPDGTTLPANESTDQNIAKFEIKTENAISANVVPDNVLARAAKWANDSADALPHPEDIRLARNVLDGTSSASKRWQHAVREFVKLWREDQAPDRPHPLDSEGWYR